MFRAENEGRRANAPSGKGLKRCRESLGEDAEERQKEKSHGVKAEELLGVHALLDFGGLPIALPSMETVRNSRNEFVGPTEESNWVIPGKLLCGAYPSEVDDRLHMNVLTSILDCGVTTFVCLQEEYTHSSKSKDAWAKGKELRPYIHDAYRICETVGSISTSLKSSFCRPEQLVFMHIPIADCNVTSDSVVARLAEALCWRLVAGEVIYIHCWGGHGRTGTVIAVMLGMLYKISKAEALKRTQLYHDLRRCPLPVPSPQTFHQRMQVLRILDSVRDQESILKQHREDPTLFVGKLFLGQEFLLNISSDLGTIDPTRFLGEYQVENRRRICSDDIADSSRNAVARSLKPPTYSSDPTCTPEGNESDASNTEIDTRDEPHDQPSSPPSNSPDSKEQKSKAFISSNSRRLNLPR